MLAVARAPYDNNTNIFFTALREIEALLPPNPLVNGKKERTSSNDGDEAEKPGSMGQGNSKASTVELAIVYIRALQKDLADTKARLEVAEKKLAEGNSSSSQTSD
jgi:chromosome segregation ATPase